MAEPAADPITGFVSPHVAAVCDYWRQLRDRHPGDRHRTPMRADLDPAEMPRAALPYVLLTDLSYQPFRVRYRLVGTHCVSIYGGDYTGLHLDELMIPDSVRAQILDDYLRVALSGLPVTSIYNWQRQLGDQGAGDSAIAEYAVLPIFNAGLVSQCLVAEHISYRGAAFPITALSAGPGGLLA